MLDASIARESNGACSTQKTIGTYETCIRNAAPNCEAQSDLTWPRDYGFLRCIQSRFDMSLHQTSLFLACLDSSPGPTAASLQTLDSSVFMGSYNYASLLLTALTVLCSFIVLTAGGVYFAGNLKLNPNWDNHIEGGFLYFWTPFSFALITVGFIWNLAGFIASVVVAFLPDHVGNTYPTTDWTSILTIAIFLLATAYFFVYFWEYATFDKWRWGSTPAAPQTAAAGGAVVIGPQPAPAEQGGPPALPGSGVDVEGGADNEALAGVKSRFYHPAWPQFQRQGYAYQSISSGRCGYHGRQNPPYHPAYRINQSYRTAQPGWRLGMKVFEDSTRQKPSDAADNYLDQYYFIDPLLSMASAWALLFVDGALLLGIVTPMQSLLSESAFFIFFGASIARVLQIVCVYLHREAFLRAHSDETSKFRLIGFKGAHFLVWLSSLFFLAVALMHFWRGQEFVSISSPTHSWMIAFLAFTIALPEVLYLVETLIGSFSEELFVSVVQYGRMVSIRFMWNYLSRVVFIIIFLFVPMNVLNDQQAAFNALILQTS